MSKFAELPDGTKLEFPDDTQDSVIDSVVKRHLGVSVEQPKDTITSGLQTIGKRAVGSFAGDLAAAGDYVAGVPKMATQAALQLGGMLLGQGGKLAEEASQQATEATYPSFAGLLEKLPNDYREGAQAAHQALMAPMEGLTQVLGLPGKVVGALGGDENLVAGTNLAVNTGTMLAAPAKALRKPKAAPVPEGTTILRPQGLPLSEKVGFPFKKTEVPTNFDFKSSMTAKKQNLAEEELQRIMDEQKEAEVPKTSAQELQNIDAQMMQYPQNLQAPQFGMGGKIAKVEDQVGREKPKFEPGERTTQTEMDLEQQRLGVENKQREIDAAWAEHTKQEPIMSREEAFAEQERLQKEQADLDTLRQQIAEEPLTLEPSQRSVEIENPQERTTHRPSPNQDTLGQTAFGRGQRGSLGVNDNAAFTEFAAAMRQKYPEVTAEQLSRAWTQTTGKQASVIKQTNDRYSKVKVFNDMGLDGDKVAFDKLSPDEVLDSLKYGEDSPPQSGVSGVFEKNLMSQGYMPSEVSNNRPLKQAIRYLKNMFDANAMRAETALFNQATGGKSGGLIHEMTRDEKLFTAGKEMTDLVKQWFAAKDNPDFQFNLTPAQQRVNQVKIKVFDKMLENINSVLPEGKKIDSVANYIPSVHDGKFWGQASMLKPDGTRTKPIMFSAMSDSGANNIAHQLKARGYEVSDVKTRGNLDTAFGEAGAENKAANFQYYLDTMGQGPEAQQLYRDISNAMQGQATTTKSAHNRLKTYSGFDGEIGNRPWLTDQQNYYQAKKAIIDTVESHYAWMSAQEGAAFGKQVLDPKSGIPENNRARVMDYINGNIIGRRYSDGLSHTINDAFTTLGIDPKLATTVSKNVSNTTTAMMTAMGNSALALTNVVQPLTVILPQMVAEGGIRAVDGLLRHGLKMPLDFALMASMKQAGEVAKLLGVDSIELRGYTKRFNEKLDFASRAGIISPTLIDQTPMFDSKAANRTHQFVLQGFLTKPSEQAARWTVFSTMADYLQGIGHSKQDAFNRAKEITETYMVDYGSDAKANIWKSLGALGHVLGRIQTFATNQWSQVYSYGKAGFKDPMSRDGAAFLTYLGSLYALGGIAGMPGFDVLEEIVNSVKSKRGDTFSLRNHLRQAVGDEVYNPFDSVTGLGMSPSFASRAINTDKNGTSLTALGAPVLSKVGDMASVAGRRLSATSPDWAAETEAEKGREIQTMLPVSARGFVEDAYLKPTVGKVQKNASPNTGLPTHTIREGEKTFGNIRSAERAANSELNSEMFKESTRLKQGKIEQEKQLNGLAADLYVYGNKSVIKENRMAKLLTDYVNKFGAGEHEVQAILDKIPNAYYDSPEIANLVRLSKKGELTLADTKQILKNIQYRELRK